MSRLDDGRGAGRTTGGLPTVAPLAPATHAAVPTPRAPVASERGVTDAMRPPAPPSRRARRERAGAVQGLPRRRPGRRLLAVGAAALVAVLAWVGWVALDALRARDALVAAAGGVDRLRAQVLDGDLEGASTTLASLQADASTARDRTHGPHWSLAGALPGTGPTARAVQTVSEVVDALATTALPALMDAAALVDPAAMAPVDGRVDLAPLVAARPGVVAADGAVQDALAAVRGVDADAVVGPVAVQLTRLDDQLTGVATATAAAARAVELLPPMLGVDGPRDYLLLVQNNAELRATGGIPGSVVLLRAEAGALEVVDQRSGGSLGDLAAPVLPLTAAEQALFGTDLAADMRDVTFTPDFPRSGEIARAIWQQQVGGDVDGVLSVDPGALAHVLGATGPVALADGSTLTAENAVRLLLNTVYLDIEDPADQDVFFADTAATVFDALVSGGASASATLDALAVSAREGRLMLWSAHPAEQALLAGTPLSGELRGVREGVPVVGLYFNDAIPAKMGYYLRSDVTTVPTDCTADGAPTFTVTVDLTSTAPADAASLPPYVTGTEDGFPRGDLQTNVLAYAPEGGRVETVRVNGGAAAVFAQTHDGLGVVGQTIQLKPGGTVQIAYDVVGGAGQTGSPVIRTTPLTASSVTAGPGADCS
ncbi:DUF4012 domain-containing protein [Cellulomonas aerilata]|uniref:DUF4012 domain-containing protein n=1 Tax=Cellulomonas aerilata TaxID=515326 RepID=A0A512DDG5_9CELL|nr:DUF4012 domain-containing protein [Cellulomonas aerilata]GEO34512.1 hypothetical protein CAE01nite_22370 [Cellulomonas aerilata]